MKKLIIASFALILGSFTSASAELGVNIGISGHSGLYYADAKETIETNPKDREDAVAVMGYTSIFIEKTLGSRFTIGYDYVPDSFSTDTAEDTKSDKLTSGTVSVTNSVKVDFEDMTTYYAAFNVTENLYVKYGEVSVDMITKESLGTGGSYGNSTIDGTVFSVGYNRTSDNGFFWRAEAGRQDFDSVTLKDSTNTKEIKATDISGVVGTLSIGKAF